ncbi:hypothetical protein ACC684_28705 [Rhizobium ruizarguesonis]
MDDENQALVKIDSRSSVIVRFEFWVLLCSAIVSAVSAGASAVSAWESRKQGVLLSETVRLEAMNSALSDYISANQKLCDLRPDKRLDYHVALLQAPTQKYLQLNFSAADVTKLSEDEVKKWVSPIFDLLFEINKNGNILSLWANDEQLQTIEDYTNLTLQNWTQPNIFNRSDMQINIEILRLTCQYNLTMILKYFRDNDKSQLYRVEDVKLNPESSSEKAEDILSRWGRQGDIKFLPPS